ncbi:MAG: ABC transporter substrate-binding protein [Thermomicrobiales bacterium]|nr:ABC transporter substrate-binding protein [Thermomicrobiales bacterium]
MFVGGRRFSRRKLLAAIPGGLLLAAGLAACGGDDDESGSSATATTAPAEPTTAADTASPTTATSPTSEAVATTFRLIPLPPEELGAPPVPEAAVSTAEGAVPHAAAVAAYDDFGTDAAPGVFPRIVRHANGETEISTKPERVVVLDSGEFDSVVNLGINPVGTLTYDVEFLPEHLKAPFNNATHLGQLSEPDIEAIAALKPDLILSTNVRHEAIYETLAAIAPTVFGISTGVVWKQNFALHAAALGLEEKGATVIEAYEERVRDLNAKLPNPRPTVSIVRVLTDNLRYYQRANYSGTLLTDLGLPRPESQNVDDFALLNQSLETIGASAPADFIYVSPYAGEQDDFAQQMLSSPLWTGLEAVKAGNFMVVSDDVWMAGIGYRAAELIMDDIEATLVGLEVGSGATDSPSGGWTFTDDRGVTVSLAEAPKRIVAQTTSAAVLWDFGLKPVGVYGPTDFQAGDINFDEVEYVGDYGALDMEKLIALKADIYVDLTPDGTALWYLSADEQKRVEAIMPTLGFTMQGVSVLTQIQRFESFVEALGVDLSSPEQAAIKSDFDDAEAELKDAIASNPGLKAIVISPTPEEIYVASPDFMIDMWYWRDLGLDLVEPETDDYWEILSWEQANKYPADLILVDARSIDQLGELDSIGTWTSLPAVAAGQIGPWYAGAPYSYVQLAPTMRELAGIIRDADANLV